MKKQKSKKKIYLTERKHENSKWIHSTIPNKTCIDLESSLQDQNEEKQANKMESLDSKFVTLTNVRDPRNENTRKLLAEGDNFYHKGKLSPVPTAGINIEKDDIFIESRPEILVNTERKNISNYFSINENSPIKQRMDEEKCVSKQTDGRIQIELSSVEHKAPSQERAKVQPEQMVVDWDINPLCIVEDTHDEEEEHGQMNPQDDKSNYYTDYKVNREDLKESVLEPSFLEKQETMLVRKNRSRVISFLRPTTGRTIKVEPEEVKIEPKNLDVIKPIGSGSFGTVYLAKWKVTKKFVALKVINKEKSKISSQKKYTVSEKKILKMIDHTFIVKMERCFESKTHLFLILEFCSGKDLSVYLDEEGCFSEEKARFYILEWICALNALHRKGIIYRDLKPNNVMLDEEGHVKLIDFNLSKSGFHNFSKKTRSFCGSYAYMPPEIIQRKSYGKDIDWYLVGVLLFEMLTGLPPYFSKSSGAIQKNIVSKKLSIPDDLSPKWRDLLYKLLDKDPARRLGYKNGAEEIVAHPWFEGISLDQVEQKELKFLEEFEPYLSKSPEQWVKNITESTREKMEIFNLRYQKIVKKLLNE